MSPDRQGVPRVTTPTAPVALSELTLDARRLCSMLDNAEIQRHTFLEKCTSLVAAAIGCSRAGIWIFMDTDAGRILRCVAMYDSLGKRMTHVPDETDSVGPYFEALENDGYVMANDARSHPATAAFFSKSLAVNGVRSLLAVSVAVNGDLYGAFTCTEVGQHTKWTPAQLALLRRIGPPLSMALYKASRFTPNTGLGPLVQAARRAADTAEEFVMQIGAQVRTVITARRAQSPVVVDAPREMQAYLLGRYIEVFLDDDPPGPAGEIVPSKD